MTCAVFICGSIDFFFFFFVWHPLLLLYIDGYFVNYRYNVAIKCATITPGTNVEHEHPFYFLNS
jgi:hypothetical protein